VIEKVEKDVVEGWLQEQFRNDPLTQGELPSGVAIAESFQSSDQVAQLFATAEIRFGVEFPESQRLEIGRLEPSLAAHELAHVIQQRQSPT
jgi:hypothetical protein